MIYLFAILTLLIGYILYKKKRGKSNTNTSNLKSHRVNNFDKTLSAEQQSKLYFEVLGLINEAVRESDIEKLLMHCQASYNLIEGLIDHTKSEYGTFDIKGIPAISYGLNYFSIFGKYGQLKNIQELVNKFPELKKIHQKEVEEAFERVELSAKILQFVKENPNCKQLDLKELSDTNNYSMITSTMSYMVKANMIKKTNVKNRVRLNINPSYAKD